METLEARRDQYLMALGACCDFAALADLVVSVDLEDGRVLLGVPIATRPHGVASEIDDLGVRRHYRFGGQLVHLETVKRFALSRPADDA